MDDRGSGGRFRILALDGGGIRGCYTASLLASLEETTGQSCADRFDLIAGTSTGGLLAIGLAMGKPARDLANFYVEYGPDIFPLTGLTKRSTGFVRHLFKPKYDPTALRTAVEKVLGETRFGEARTRLVIPSYDITEGRIFVFKTAHHERFRFDTEIPAVDIALATAAAPTYFPATLISEHSKAAYVDGGVWANNPSLVAITEALSFLEVDLASIDVLSIGTTTGVVDFSEEVGSGALEWGTDLISLLMTAQAQMAEAVSGLLAGTHYRINAVVPDSWSAMDDIAKIRELIVIGSNDAKKKANLEVVEKTFLNDVPIKRYVPEV